VTARRHLAGALVLVTAALAAAVPASAADPGTTLTGHATRIGPHDMRVLVKAPGDLHAMDVQAMLNSHLADVQKISRTGPHQRLDLVFAVDTSGSMAGQPIAAAKAAGQHLLDAVGSGDQVGLVSFSNGVAVQSPLTSDVARVRTDLSDLTTSNGTALRDGVASALELEATDTTSKRVVVVLSDGADTTSHIRLPALLASLQASGVEVDTVGLSDSTAFTALPLQQIAKATGGHFVQTSSFHGLEPLLARLSQDRLSSTYAVDIHLPPVSGHTLQVSVRGASPATVSLPAGVSGVDSSPLDRYGAWLVALLGMLAVGVISYLLFTARQRRPAALHHRLAQYSSDVAKTGPKVQAAALLDLYEGLEQRFGRRAFWKYLDRLCQRAGTNVHTGQIVLVIAACFVAPVVLLAAGAGILVTLVACVAAGAIPVAVLRFRATRRQHKFDSQLPELLGVWASALRAGRSFAQALDTMVEEASEPAHEEFRRVQNQVRLGVPIEQALDDMSKRLGSESFELVVLTTDVQRRIGGNVAEFFDQVADTVRKRQQFSMRVRALTATGVLSARVLLGMPFALAGILTLINHSYMSPLYTTTTGHVLIVIALLMMFAGYAVLRRIVRPRAVA